MTMIAISEIFGPTVQGEGPNTGKRCSFVRFARCNLSCSWCDTPYTWDWKGKNGKVYDPALEVIKLQAWQIEGIVSEHATDRVVITGGEPTVQMTGLVGLCQEFYDHGYEIEIETNGTHAPSPNLDHLEIAWNVSPKLGHAGDPYHLRINVPALKALQERGANFKFVCASQEDLDEVQLLVDLIGADMGHVWIMPEGKTQDDVETHLQLLAEAAIARGWNLTTRLHVNIWGDRRGV